MVAGHRTALSAHPATVTGNSALRKPGYWISLAHWTNIPPYALQGRGVHLVGLMTRFRLIFGSAMGAALCATSVMAQDNAPEDLLPPEPAKVTEKLPDYTAGPPAGAPPGGLGREMPFSALAAPGRALRQGWAGGAAEVATCRCCSRRASGTLSWWSCWF